MEDASEDSKRSSNTPLISVILATYNDEDYIVEAIQSIQEQSYENIEIIVVDDGSTDTTGELVRSHFADQVRYIYQANSGGPSSPRNVGLSVAQGEFIAFFDPDDVMQRDKLAKQLKVLQTYTDVALVFMDYCNFNSTQKWPNHFSTCVRLQHAISEYGVDQDLSILPSNVATAVLIEENFGIAGSPLYRRSSLIKQGGYNEELKSSEDFVLYYLVSAEHSVAILTSVGYERRLHDTNLTNNSSKYLEFYVLSRAYLLSCEVFAQNKALLRRRIALGCISLSEFCSGKASVKAMASLFKAIKYYPSIGLEARWWKTLVKILIRRKQP